MKNKIMLAMVGLLSSVQAFAQEGDAMMGGMMEPMAANGALGGNW